MANASILQTDWHLFSNQKPTEGSCIIVYWDEPGEDIDRCFISTEMEFTDGKLHFDSDYIEIEYPANAIWSYWPNPT